MSRGLTFAYLALTLALFFYSYGFVDLNLTLSAEPHLFALVSSLQGLVYFNRPLSTQIYLFFVFAFFSLYLLVLNKSRSLKLTKFPLRLVVVLAVIFSLFYPFLSSDLFKYLFSAKMVVLYHANPHVVTPDFFASDPWIRFMRWVHTPSPYGPVFTLMMIPYYLLGLGKFVPAMYLYKLDAVFWYLLSIWLVGKLSYQLFASKEKQLTAKLFFALNPLILYEWLGNGHNDAPMLSLLLLSLYLLTLKKKVWALFALLLSIGIKYVTIFLLPAIFLKNLNLKKTLYYLLFAFTLVPLVYNYSFQYQPWYVTWIIPFAAVLGQGSIMWVVGAYSLGSLLRYLPFVSTSLWGATPFTFALLSFAPPIITLLIILFYRRLRRL